MNLIKKTAGEVFQEVVAILGSAAIMSLMLWAIVIIK